MPYYVSPGFSGWFDDVTSIAKSIIPPHTIVGKVLNGNISGAASSTAKLLSGGGGSASAPKPAPVTVASPGLFSPGGFVEKNQTVLLLAAAGLVAILVMKRKGRR